VASTAVQVHLVILASKIASLHQTFELFGGDQPLLLLRAVKLDKGVSKMVPFEGKRSKSAIGTAIINASDMRQTQKGMAAKAADWSFDSFSADDTGVFCLVGK
jgi:hypothetical protein